MIECSWNDVMFGRMQIEHPVIYMVLDPDGACAYVGKSVNVGKRFLEHQIGHNSRLPELLSNCPNPNVALYSIDEVEMYSRAFFRKIYESDEKAWVAKNLEELWNRIPNDERMSYAEFVTIYTFCPRLNRYGNGRRILTRYGHRDLARVVFAGGGKTMTALEA